ncbi:MAG: stalk domain-containing protein [Armatimonadota bacterium]
MQRMSLWLGIAVVLTGFCTSFIHAQETLTAPVLSSNNEHCTSLDPLATWLGASSAWSQDKLQVKVVCGKRSLQLQAGSTLATDSQGQLKRLPTCPVWEGDVFFVPTRILIEELGGAVTAVPTGLQISYQGRTALLPSVQAAPTAEKGLARIGQLAVDPRVPLDGVQADIQRANQVHKYMDGFYQAASPIQPTLKSISESKTLLLMSHIPVVGSFIKLAQATIGTVNESITFVKRVSEFDKQYYAPVRDGLNASRLVAKDPTAANITTARPQWTNALAGVDKQLTLNNNTIYTLNRLSTTLTQIGNKQQEFQKAYPKIKMPLAVAPLQKANKQTLTVLDAQRWQMKTLHEYFTRLLEESKEVQ